MQHRSIAAWGLAALCVLTVAACGGDDLLAPPDGTACTVGSIAPGDSADGQIAGSSCKVWSDYNYKRTVAESWTLNAKAHTAYVVRVYHRADTAGFDNWQGDVWLYARNAAGDAEWAGGWYSSFGANNANGGQNEELVFASAKAQTVSIRVEANTPADTGLYTIVVEACAAPALQDGVTSAAVAVDSACTMLSNAAGSHVAFWTFTGDTLNGNSVTFTRTAGTELFGSHITGEGLDFACYSNSCTSESVADSTGPVTIYPSLYLPGTFTAWVTIPLGGTGTVTAELATGPFAAPRRPFSGPARAGRTR